MDRNRPARRKLFRGKRVDSWKDIWQDQHTTWEMDSGDFEDLDMHDGYARTHGAGDRNGQDGDGNNAQLQIVNTVHSGCGLVTTTPNFKVYCRACSSAARVKPL